MGPAERRDARPQKLPDVWERGRGDGGDGGEAPIRLETLASRLGQPPVLSCLCQSSEMSHSCCLQQQEPATCT